MEPVALYFLSENCAVFSGGCNERTAMAVSAQWERSESLRDLQPQPDGPCRFWLCSRLRKCFR